MSSRRLQVVLDLDTGRYSGRLTDAASRMRMFQGSVDRGSTSVRKLSSSFDNLNNKMSTPLQKLRDYVIVLGNVRLAILNVRDIAVGWVGALMNQSAQVERLMVLMRGLSNATDEVGRNQEAVTSMRMLFQEARRSGFAVDALADSFVKMKSGGLDPADGSLRSLTNAVAAFGGTSDVMHRASIAIQQMAGKGVISMEELRQQLGEAVPTAMADMARAMGMSVAEFSKLVSKGIVQAKPALELMFMEFDRLYGGAGERMANTFNGQLSIFRTNLMELSTFFTGFNMDTGAAEKGGLYDSLTKGIRELNAAMQSGDGKQFARDIGQIVATVASGIAQAARFIVQFRDEIGAMAKVALSAFLAIKAANFFQFLFQGANALRLTLASSFASIRSGFAVTSASALQASGAIQGSLASLALSSTRSSAAINRLVASKNALNRASLQAMTANGREVQTTGLAVIAAERKVAAIEAQRRSLMAKIATEQAAIRSAQREQTIAQANIATGVRLESSIARVNAAKRNATLASIRLASAERALASTNVQLATATQVQTAAVSANTAAMSRSIAVTTAATVGLQAKAAAAGIAAGAMRVLAVSVNLVLGPLGMIAIALYAAADAAGVFENRAKRAAQAAADLRAGIATIENIEEMNKRNQQLANENKSAKEALDKGGRWVTSRNADGPTQRFVPLTSEDRKRLEGTVSKNNAEISRNTILARNGVDTIAKNRGEEGANTLTGVISRSLADEENKYRNIAKSDAPQAQKDAAAEELAAARRNAYNVAIATTERNREKALKEGRTSSVVALDAMLGKLRETAGSTEDLSEKTARLREEAIGGAKANNQAAKSLNSQATEAENLKQRFDDMIGSQKGEIAGLTAQLEGSETAFAKFKAEVDAGLFKGATADQLDQLAEGFKKIDQLNADIDFGRGMRQLRREISQSAEAAEGLWRALQADNTGAALEQYRRVEGARAQYADKLEAATRTGDPAKIAEVEAEIDKLVATLGKIEAVEMMDSWRQMTEEIELSLLDEDEARQLSFERELARQVQMRDEALANATLTADQRRMIEQRFYDWKAAREAQLARQNESETVKMARQWAMLGQNIESSLAGALNSFVDGMFEAEFSFADFAKSIIKEIVKIIIKAMIAYAIMSALGLNNNSSGGKVSFGDFMKGQIGAGFGGNADPSTSIGFGAGGAGSSLQQPLPGGRMPGAPADPFPQRRGGLSVPAIIAHTGGIIGQIGSTVSVDPGLFAKAKTYHTGTNSIGGRALRPGEVPIIGMKGEAVLTEQHQAEISKRLKAGNALVEPAPVTVNVINNSSTQLSAEQGQPEFNGKEMIVNVVVEAAQKQGPLRDVLSNMGKS